MYLIEKIVNGVGNKVLVKLLGFIASQNTWEDSRSIII